MRNRAKTSRLGQNNDNVEQDYNLVLPQLFIIEAGLDLIEAELEIIEQDYVVIEQD